MTYAITKYTKKQLAKMDSVTLAHSVKLLTDRLYGNCLAAAKDVAKATSSAEKERALATLDAANKAWDDYLEEQKAIAVSLGCYPEYHKEFALVPTGEINANGKEIIRAIKREQRIAQPIDLVDLYADDRKAMNEAPTWESDEDWERAGEED